MTDLGAGAPATEVAGRLAACGWSRLHTEAEARERIVFSQVEERPQVIDELAAPRS